MFPEPSNGPSQLDSDHHLFEPMRRSEREDPAQTADVSSIPIYRIRTTSNINSNEAHAQANYAKATKAELSRQFNQAFQYYVKSAELYLHLSGSEGGKEKDRVKWKANAEKALLRAEKIKSFSDKTTAQPTSFVTERKGLDADSAEVRLTPVAVNHFASRTLIPVPHSQLSSQFLQMSNIVF